MTQQTVDTAEFGTMTLDSATHRYETQIDIPCVSSKRLSIAVEDFATGLKRAHEFLSWFEGNHESFKLPMENAIQDYDLVFDDLWDSILGEEWIDEDEGFLAEYLEYDSVHVAADKVYLWVNTSGLHTDHMVKVTIDKSMKIELCEMM